MNLLFLLNPHIKEICVARIKRIKSFNGKVGQRDATKISGSRPMLNGEILPSKI